MNRGLAGAFQEMTRGTLMKAKLNPPNALKPEYIKLGFNLIKTLGGAVILKHEGEYIFLFSSALAVDTLMLSKFCEQHLASHHS